MKKHSQFTKSKLSRQLLSGFGASLVVIGIATVSITYTTLQKNLEQQIQRQAESITSGLEFASEGAIEIQEMYLLERIVQNYATLPAVIEISIVDPNGILLAHSNAFELSANPSRRYLDLHPALAYALQQSAQKGVESNIRTVLHGKPVVVQIRPFSSTLFNQSGLNQSGLNQSGSNQSRFNQSGSSGSRQPKNRGVAIAIMDLQKLEQEAQQNTLSSILAIVGSATLILLFMAWLIQKIILSPLSQINLAITQSDGQSSFSLPTLPKNEIGFLGTRFAAVFEQLKAYKQMELEMIEQKYAEVAQRYELATRAAKVWVWDWEIETDIFVLDQGVQEWLGYVNLELPKYLLAWANYIYIEDRDRFLRALQFHLAGRTDEFSCEHRLLKADDSLHWFLSRGQVVKDEYGQPIRAIGTITDIAERKQVEAQLQQTNAELLRATRLKDEFLANMSHELRTPLNAILGMAEGLEEGVFGKLNEPQLKALQTVGRSGSHLLSLINDILDLAKIEAGQITLECAAIPVAPLCQSSLAFIKQQALKKHIQLEIKLPPKLPYLLVDERRIRQVLINLLNNAVKFTPEKGCITLEVNQVLESRGQESGGTQQELSGFATRQLKPETSSKEQGAGSRSQELPNAWLRVSVIDTGIGIAPENIEKLFQPFVQIDSALNRQYAGTGLGLALVHKIVHLHGGQVELTSEVGVGSCFTIELPCAPAALAQPIASDQTMDAFGLEAVPANEAVSSPLILLVEDSEANISTISSYLKAKGYRIVLAKNGQEGISIAHTQHPNLILMDIQMPGMDGLEATKQIRRDPTLVNTPIIALTALAMAGDRDRCLEAGATEYLTKPVRLKELSQMMQTLLAP